MLMKLVWIAATITAMAIVSRENGYMVSSQDDDRGELI
jgi:hypothetical protein